MLSGLSGFLIIDGLLETHYPELAAAHEKLLVLKDIELPGARDGTAKTKTINGQAQPVIRIRPGEWQFWRVGNIGADSFFDIAVDGHELVALAHDGNILERPARATSVFLPPASRGDLMIEGGAPGIYAIRSRAVDTGAQGDPNPEVVLGTLVVEGQPVDGRAMTARLKQSAKDYGLLTQTAARLRNAPITRRRTIVFSESADGNTFFIDGKMYDEGRIDTEVRLGDIEEWTIVNKTGERHVFHIHQLDFVVTMMKGQALDYEGLRDVIDVQRLRCMSSRAGARRRSFGSFAQRSWNWRGSATSPSRQRSIVAYLWRHLIACGSLFRWRIRRGGRTSLRGKDRGRLLAGAGRRCVGEGRSRRDGARCAAPNVSDART